MVRRFLVGFVCLNLQFSASWQVDFQWGSCGSIFSFLCHGWQTFSGVRVAQSLVFCVMVGRLLVGFVWLNRQISVPWLVDFQWGSCGSIFSFPCPGRQTFSGVRVAQSLLFCVMVGRLFVGFVWLNLQFSASWQVDFQWGSCGSIFSFQCHGWQTFSGVRVALSLVFCVMVGRLLVGFVCLNLQFCVSWQVDFQWASCVSIFSFLCHGWQTFSGVRVAQSLLFCVMVGRILVGFVLLNLQFSLSWLVDFQWGSCGSIFNFLYHAWQIFSGVRVAQSLVFCVMVGRFLVGFMWLNLVFCIMVGRLLVGFVWLNLQFSVSWQVDFQWGSCCSMFSFLCHCRQTFRGVRVAQSLVFCVMVGRLLVGFVWLNLQSSVSWQVDFQWGSCGSIFSFLDFQWGSFGANFSVLRHGWQTFNGVREAQSLVFCVKVGDFQWGSCGSMFSFLRHGSHTFSGVRVSQSFVFCVMVGRLLLGFVWLKLQFSMSWLVDFQWGSCGSIFTFLCHGWLAFRWVRGAQSLVFCVMVDRLLGGSCGSIFSFLCHGWQTFRGVREAQYLVFCVMVGKLLEGFVRLNIQFSVSWLVDFQWGSCGSIFSFVLHGRQTFSGVRVAQSLVFCVMVGRLLVGFL